MRDLSPKQLRFVQEYLRCGVASEAARAAGYSPSVADRAAMRVMKKPKVLAEIDKGRAALRTETKYTLEAAVRETSELMQKAIDAKQFTAAATLLSHKLKMHGYLVDRIQVDTPDIKAALAEAVQRTSLARIEPPTLDVTPEPDEQEAFDRIFS